MTAPVRIQLSRQRGFNLQEVSRATNGLPAVNVARPTIWSNPFVIGDPSGYRFKDGGDTKPLIEALTRDQSVELYDALILGVLSPEMHPCGHEWLVRLKRKFGSSAHPTTVAWTQLRDRNLACWCDGFEKCHADVLLRVANHW